MSPFEDREVAGSPMIDVAITCNAKPVPVMTGVDFET